MPLMARQKWGWDGRCREARCLEPVWKIKMQNFRRSQFTYKRLLFLPKVDWNPFLRGAFRIWSFFTHALNSVTPSHPEHFLLYEFRIPPSTVPPGQTQPQSMSLKIFQLSWRLDFPLWRKQHSILLAKSYFRKGWELLRRFQANQQVCPTFSEMTFGK